MPTKRLPQAVQGEAHKELSLTHNERLEEGPFRRALELMDERDAPRLRAHLAAHSKLIEERARFEGENYFTTPSLLEFLPENPVRQGEMPKTALGRAGSVRGRRVS